jgi:hypothetical protein
MIEDPWHRSTAVGPELIEGLSGSASRVVMEAVAPVALLRSPLMEHRPVEPLPPDLIRESRLLPPLRTLPRPSRLDILVAASLLLVTGWQVAILVGIGLAGYRALDRRIDRSGFSLGDGFLAFRAQTGWPQGVQEDNDVRWNWSPANANAPTRGGQP